MDTINDQQTFTDNVAQNQSADESPLSDFRITLHLLPDQQIITKKDLANIFGRSVRTIDRMVQRHELPAATSFGGESVWTAGIVKKWVFNMIDESEKQSLADKARIDRY